MSPPVGGGGTESDRLREDRTKRRSLQEGGFSGSVGARKKYRAFRIQAVRHRLRKKRMVHVTEGQSSLFRKLRQTGFGETLFKGGQCDRGIDSSKLRQSRIHFLQMLQNEP